MSEASEDEVSILRQMPTPLDTQRVQDIPESGGMWSSHNTLLMFSIAHMVAKDGLETKIDWDTVSEKLHSCKPIREMSQYAFSSKDCEERYFQLLQFADINLKEPQPAFVKREFIIKTIAHGLLCASQVREKILKCSIKSLANRETSESEGAGEEPLYSDQISDQTCGDNNLPADSPEIFKNEESFSMKYATCFDLDNIHFDTPPSMEIADVYLKNSSTGVSAERDSNSPAISPVLIVVDHIGTTIPADSTSPHKGQNSYTDANESTQQDVPRHATAAAPTLSKLLELPPRDRNQPLPQVNSLAQEISSASELLGSSISPLEQQDSSTKLLAALGTTTTAVKISQLPVVKVGGGDKLPFVYKLPASPLKAMDEIEIANDYVMESGLIPCDSVEPTAVDESTVKEQFVAPASLITPKIEIDSNTQKDVLYGGVEVKNIVNQAEAELSKEIHIVEKSDALESTTMKNENTTPQKDENSNSGADLSVKKRLTRRSVKIEAGNISNLKDAIADDGGNKDDSGSKETKTRQKTLPQSRINSITCENVETLKIDESIANEIFVVPSSPIVPKIEADSNTQKDVLYGGVEVKNTLNQPETELLEDVEKSDPLESPTRKNANIALQKDENSNSGTDDSAKKRLTRRSVKIGSRNVPSLKDTIADDGGDKNDAGNKETKARHKILPQPRINSISESADKEEQLDGKRVTRARAKTSVSPSWTKTRTTGFSKTQGKSDGDTETSESGETMPLRATRSRLIIVSPGTSTVIATAESVPSSISSIPCSPGSSTVPIIKDEEVKDIKSWKKSMLTLINRVIQHPDACVLNIRSGTEEIVTSYRKQIKRPMDLLTIKKNIEAGVIKTPSQLQRDLNLIFMNLVMYNHLPGTSDITVPGLHSEVAAYCQHLFEEFRNVQKPSNINSDGCNSDGPDVKLESTEEVKNKSTVTEKLVGRKRRNRSISTGHSEETQESKRRTLRTSTAAATTATSAWQSTRQKKTGSTQDLAAVGRGRQE